MSRRPLGLSAALLAAVAAAPPALASQAASQKLLYPAPHVHGQGVDRELVLADFDGDGRLDVAGSAYGVNAVSFLAGAGDGTFAPPLTSSVSLVPREAGDFDGDSVVDLAGTVPEGAGIALGLGSGGFSPPAIASLAYPASRLDLGDVDGDGRLDLVALNALSTQQGLAPALVVLLGDGGGGFAGSATVPLAGGPIDVELLDLDGDGVLDAALPDQWLSAVQIHLGAGNGGFYLAGSHPVSPAPSGITSGDFDGNGLSDLATTGSTCGCSVDSAISVLLGDGRAGFAPAVVELVGTSYSSRICAADFDQDGGDDLAAASQGDTAVVLLGLRSAGFGEVLEFAGTGGYALAPGDVNGDGLPDLLAGSYYGFTVLLSEPATGLSGPKGPPVTHEFGGLHTTSVVEIADLDGDGVLDLAGSVAPYGLEGPAKLLAALGTGDGGLISHPVAAIHGTVRAAGDLNGDGARDLVAADKDSVAPLIGAGDGTFDELASTYGGDGIHRGVSADLDSDGRDDVALPGEDSMQIAVLLTRPDGSLHPPSFFGAFATFESLTASDLDGDGDLDLAAGEDKQFNGVYVLEGAGDGTFSHAQLVPLPFVKDLAALDWNHDGIPDVAATNGTVHLLRGMGAGLLSPPKPIALPGTWTQSLCFADLDSDGRTDFLGTGNGYAAGSGFTVMLGQGGPLLGPPAFFAGRGVPRAGDLDGDGHLDVAMMAPGEPAQLAVAINRSAKPAMLGAVGLFAAASGETSVYGGPFDAATQVAVGGVPVPATVLGPFEISVILPVAEPGFADVEVSSAFGSSLAPGMLARWPALAAGPAPLGGTLVLELENGGPGAFALAWAPAVLATPQPFPGIHSGLWLSPAVPFLLGSIGTGEDLAAHALSVPSDPGLLGKIVHFQAWSQQAGAPISPATSFSNHALVVIE